MIVRKPLFLGSVILATASLTSCASLLGGEPVKVRPVETMSSLTPAQSDPLYEGAVTAINERDYARALDYLQQAKAGNPEDVKVLNALGVVYDKLGRFDLSARYYGQAQAVDPSSRIVAANVEYSKVLQGWQDPGQHPAIAALAAPIAQSAPIVQLAAIPSPAETMAVDMPPGLTQPITPMSARPKEIFAPAIRPAESTVVVLAIPPESVAPTSAEVEKKTAVIADTNASGPPVVPPTEPQRVALLTSPKVNPGTMSGLVALPALPAPTDTVPPKLPAVLPRPAASITSFARPADRQQSASLSTAHLATDTSVKVSASSIESAVATPVSARQPAALLARTITVAPVIHPARAQLAALIAAPRLAPPSGKPDEKPATQEPRKAPAVVVLGIASPKKPNAPPHVLAFVAPVTHSESKQLFALGVPATVKPLKSAVDIRTPVPVAFRKAIVPLAPVKIALAGPGSAKVLTVGKPVKILNASGKPIGAISHRLAVLGWTVRQFDWRMQPVTTLYYPQKNIMAARAMVRTLPFPVRFVSDSDDSFAMRLVIGHDFLSWNPRNSRLAALWQKGPVIASLQKPLLRGVR
jgi:hypothetical protein